MSVVRSRPFPVLLISTSDMDDALDAMSKVHDVPAWVSIATLLVAGTVLIFGNWIASVTHPADALPGMLIKLVIIALGTGVYRLLAFTKIPFSLLGFAHRSAGNCPVLSDGGIH
ncbi:putative predicted protein [Rhizobium favelukesii]|uniref:Uncharacterized protein n=1 Tax=Rhizobium favelukesii TaxID=348824 RepID=W6R903_9HYPH|nr:putative predicted protein [Rhizobium favelukesii]